MPIERGTETDINSRRALIREKIDEIYKEFQGTHNENQRTPITRNILLVGLSKSGKTTFKRVMRDPRYIPEDVSLFDDSDATPDVERDIYIDDFSLILNLVEVPEAMIDNERDLSEINKTCSQKQIREFHLIILFTSFTAGIDGRALQSFLRLIVHLGENKVRHNLYLMITRCEAKDEQQLIDMKTEINRDKFFQKLSSYIGNKIFFSGALNEDKWNTGDNGLINEFITVSRYRESILQSIRNSNVCFALSDGSRAGRSSSPPLSPEQQRQQQQKPSTDDRLYFDDNREPGYVYCLKLWIELSLE
jgi:GTPase SAR1 family protein